MLRLHRHPAPLTSCLPNPPFASPRTRVWRADDLAPLQTLATGGGWVTDVAYVEGPPGWGRKLVVASQDRTVGGPGGGWGRPNARPPACLPAVGGLQALPSGHLAPTPRTSPAAPPPTHPPPNRQLSFFDPGRSGFDPAGALACTGAMGPPQCLAELERAEGQAGAAPRLVWGDTGGRGGVEDEGWWPGRERHPGELGGARCLLSHCRPGPKPPARPARPQRAR